VATVMQLVPGDLVTSGRKTATFVTRTIHPDDPRLMLVVWQLSDASWSFDKLHPDQQVGQITPSTIRQRTNRLRVALTGS